MGRCSTCSDGSKGATALEVAEQGIRAWRWGEKESHVLAVGRQMCEWVCGAEVGSSEQNVSLRGVKDTYTIYRSPPPR